MKLPHQIFALTLCLLPISIQAASENRAPDALHLDWLDKSVKPSDDFYAYANGHWQQNNAIPAQYSSWGSFSILQDRVQKIIHKMLLEASKNTSSKPGSIEQKVGDFYYSGMDVSMINKLGVTPLSPELYRIENIKTQTDLQKEIAHLHSIGVDVCFSFDNMQDFKNSEKVIGAAMQDGLGLPDRDYYLKQDKKFQKIREDYIVYITHMFQLLGDTPVTAAENASVIMGIETTLAKASMTQVAQRDPHAIYHMKTLAELNQAMPNFSWASYFKSRGYPGLSEINLGMPEFFSQFDKMLQDVSLPHWKIYLRWHLLNSYASYLSDPFVQEHFLMTASLSGTKKLIARWQRVVSTENGALGFAIGKLYVEKYVPPQAKEQVQAILKTIRDVLHTDLKTLSWMTPATRTAALKKLDLMEGRVGYPSKWRDYSDLSIDRGPYVLNVLRSNQFLVKRELDKIGKPVDKTEWAMTPQTINAYYDPSMNNINMTAGIMQSPFFDPKAPAAVNYGAIGFVMGHEMTHGFDDMGAQFDGYGNLKQWWSPVDLTKFQAATNCIVTQFSQYKVDEDMSVQGPLVVGEATADLGGLILAYRAFHASDAYKTAKIIDGFTPDQQFFLSAAHVWAQNIRPEQLRNLVTTDPHPPAKYRVNGTIVNMPEFKKAFEIPNSMTNNQHQCVIW